MEFLRAPSSCGSKTIYPPTPSDRRSWLREPFLYVNQELFHRLVPRYAKDFWPLSVVIRALGRSALVFLNSLGSCQDSVVKKSLGYWGARELRDLWTIKPVSCSLSFYIRAMTLGLHQAHSIHIFSSIFFFLGIFSHRILSLLASSRFVISFCHKNLIFDSFSTFLNYITNIFPKGAGIYFALAALSSVKSPFLMVDKRRPS